MKTTVKSSPTAWVIDTNIFSRIVDGRFLLSSLPTNTRLIFTHIQLDEIKQIPDVPDEKKALRERLLAAVIEINPEKVPTESAVWNTSKWGEAKWTPEDSKYQLILAALDKKRKKPNNKNDALIGEVALKNSYGLITADNDLAEVMTYQGVPVKKIQ